MNFNFLRTNICLVAFWHILCSAHLSLLDMVTPKCLWLSTWFQFSESNFRFIGFMFCRNEITIYSVFWGLKSTSHCFAQLSKTWRSKFNLSSTSNGLVDALALGDLKTLLALFLKQKRVRKFTWLDSIFPSYGTAGSMIPRYLFCLFLCTASPPAGFSIYIF